MKLCSIIGMIASLCRTVLDIQRIEQCSSPQHLASLCLQTCDVGKTLKTMEPCCGQTELGQIYRTGSARHRQPDKNLDRTDFSAKEPIFSLIVIERRDGSCWQSTKDCRSGVMGLLTQTTSKLSVGQVEWRRRHCRWIASENDRFELPQFRTTRMHLGARARL